MSTRLSILRRAVTARPGIRWTTRRAWRLYRAHGIPQRGTARRDLPRLAAEGLLVAHGPDDGRYYTTNPNARCPRCGYPFEECTCTGTTGRNPDSTVPALTETKRQTCRSVR